jgi:hypothetical protein
MATQPWAECSSRDPQFHRNEEVTATQLWLSVQLVRCIKRSASRNCFCIGTQIKWARSRSSSRYFSAGPLRFNDCLLSTPKPALHVRSRSDAHWFREPRDIKRGLSECTLYTGIAGPQTLRENGAEYDDTVPQTSAHVRIGSHLRVLLLPYANEARRNQSARQIKLSV